MSHVRNEVMGRFAESRARSNEPSLDGIMKRYGTLGSPRDDDK